MTTDKDKKKEKEAHSHKKAKTSKKADKKGDHNEPAVDDGRRRLDGLVSKAKKDGKTSELFKATLELAATADENGMTYVLSILQKLYSNPPTAHGVDPANIRRDILQNLLQTFHVSRKRLSELVAWRKAVVKYLAEIACLKPEALTAKISASPQITVADGADARQRLEAFVGSLLDDSMKQSRGKAEENLASWQFFAVQAITESPQYDNFPGDKETVSNITDLISSLQSRQAVEDSPVLEIFLSIMVIFNFTEGITDDELDDAFQLARKIAQDETSDVGSMFAEFMIQLASRKSVTLKRACDVFTKAYGGAVVDKEALELFYKVLATKETLEGQNELFDVHNDEEEMEDDDVDDEDDDSEKDDEESDDQGEDEDEDDEVEEEVEEADDELKEFEEKLSKVLGVKRKREGDEDSEEDEEEDEDMTDDQMLALDGHIAALFKDRLSGSEYKQKVTSRKQLEAQARDNIIYIKSRILDVLKAYLRSLASVNVKRPSVESSTGILLMTMFTPMLNLLKHTGGTKTTQLTASAGELIRQDLTKLVFKAENPEKLCDILRSLVDEVQHTNSPTHSGSCSALALYLCKISVYEQTPEDKVAVLKALASIYGDTLVAWAGDKRSPVQSRFFEDFVRWLGQERTK
ncbi:uncharacterized protein V1518DRAFT_421113 [Limtongia smithiae]|uniref:uncharacterized protein n=1 Tax=Limtongia smithiae TaxID=1125753 RepID=UPI0034CD0587